jgi:hypothetical protein
MYCTSIVIWSGGKVRGIRIVCTLLKLVPPLSLFQVEEMFFQGVR